MCKKHGEVFIHMSFKSCLLLYMANGMGVKCHMFMCLHQHIGHAAHHTPCLFDPVQSPNMACPCPATQCPVLVCAVFRRRWRCRRRPFPSKPPENQRPTRPEARGRRYACGVGERARLKMRYGGGGGIQTHLPPGNATAGTCEGRWIDSKMPDPNNAGKALRRV